MSELEKACMRAFCHNYVRVRNYNVLALQSCTPPLPQPIEYESVPIDSTLA